MSVPPGRNRGRTYSGLPDPQVRPWHVLPLETRQDFRVFFAIRGVPAYRVLVYPLLLIFQIHPRYFSTLYNEYEKKPAGVTWIIEPISRWRHALRLQSFEDHLGSARIVEGNYGVIYRDS